MLAGGECLQIATGYWSICDSVCKGIWFVHDFYSCRILKTIYIYILCWCEAASDATKDQQASEKEPRFIMWIAFALFVSVMAWFWTTFCQKSGKAHPNQGRIRKKSHIAVEIYWRKNGETKGDTKATGTIGNENTKLLVVIVQKVIDPLNVIFETSFRKDEPGQDEQNLKQNSYSDAQWMKWHNDQKVLGIHLFVLFSSVTSYFAFQFFAFLQALWKKKHKWNDFEWTKHMVPGFCKNTD